MVVAVFLLEKKKKRKNKQNNRGIKVYLFSLCGVEIVTSPKNYILFFFFGGGGGYAN